MDKRYEDFLIQAGNFIFVENEPEQADIIFVPGNRYPQMAETAAELYKKGFAPRVLPSGRYSVTLGKFTGVLEKREIYNGNYETEWEFLKDVLVKNGVPEEIILKEDQATYTYQNAQLSKKVLEKAGIIIKKAILCCKTHHARRCLMYYQRVFPEVEFFVVPVDVDGILKENWQDSEEGVEAVTGEISRILTQFEILMKEKK